MVMAHDAATSYLKGGFFHQINDWAKTQGDGGFTAMLNCGSRAFDVRPKMTSDGIHFHHGKIDISKKKNGHQQVHMTCENNQAEH